MAWAAALGAGIGEGSSGMASAAQYQASKHERNIAWKRAQQWELMAPRLRVEGLRNAGLNPVLAATQGFSGGATNVQMADPGSTPNFDSDAVGKVVSAARQAKLMDEELVNLQENAELTRQKREQVAQETRITEETADLLSEFGHQRQKLEILGQAESIKNVVAERGFTSARQAESEASAARQIVDKALAEAGVSGARAMEQFYSEHPWARVVREFGGGSLVGSGVGAGVAGAGAAGGYLFGQRRREKDDFGKNVPGKSKRRK